MCIRVYPLLSSMQCACAVWSPMCRMVIHGLPSPTIFFHIISQMAQFSKKLLNVKCAFWFPLHSFPAAFFIPRRTERYVIKNVYWSSRKVLFILALFLMKLDYSGQFFSKILKFHENSSSWSQANVLENDNFKLYWNRSIIVTDKTTPANRPDITFTNIKTKTTYFIDIAVPNTHNLAKTITEKQSKHQELANEICAMWKQNTVQVIPIVISSTGVIPKSLPQSLSRFNLHPNTYTQMQKSVILGTFSIVRNFLNHK